jgi:hypothetical protein
MSQWSTIKIKGAGLEVDISQIASAVDKVAEEAVTNAAAVETTRQQLLTLSRQLEHSQALSVTSARALRDSLSRVPAADTGVRPGCDLPRRLRERQDSGHANDGAGRPAGLRNRPRRRRALELVV